MSNNTLFILTRRCVEPVLVGVISFLHFVVRAWCLLVVFQLFPKYGPLVPCTSYLLFLRKVVVGVLFTAFQRVGLRCFNFSSLVVLSCFDKMRSALLRGTKAPLRRCLATAALPSSAKGSGDVFVFSFFALQFCSQQGLVLQVVIMGGGIIGNSVAYHLGKLGMGKDVVLLEVNTKFNCRSQLIDFLHPA